MTMSSRVVCNNILQRAFSENIEITPMKLQKIMYLVACDYAKSTGKELFSERFCVWQTGPVLPSVHSAFSCFTSKKITCFLRNATDEVFIIDENTAPYLRRSIDYVWNKYRFYTGIELANMCVKESSGWYKAFSENREIIGLNDLVASI